MRVATYTDASAPVQGSGFAVAILVATLLLGTGVLPTLADIAGGFSAQLITPAWLALYLGSTLALMFSFGINWISWLVRYRLLLAILLLGSVVSVSWAIDSQVSAERVVHLLGSSLIAIFIGFSIPLLLTLRIFAVVLGVMLVASVGAVFALPDVGIENYEGAVVWRGVFTSKNDLGFWAAVGVLLYVTLSESSNSGFKKFLCFALAGLSSVVLMMSQSATSLLAMLVAGSLALYLYIAGRFQLGFFRMLFIAILFIALTALAISNVETTELVGRSGDLTGRSEVWLQVIDLILRYPLTGVGYGVLWFPTDETIWVQQNFFDFTWVVHHAHNGLLHVASEIGMPLSVVALLMVVQQTIEIFYCQYERRQVGVLFVLAFVAAFLVSNFSEARFLVSRELFWIFFLALPISVLRQVNMTDADDSDMRDQANSQAMAFSPDKPWLDPNFAGTDQMGAYHRLPQRPAVATESYPRLTQDSDKSLDPVDGDDPYDISFSRLSVDNADINLGTDSAQEPTPSSDEPAGTQLGDEGAILMHDQTSVNDRYDINFDEGNEWIDIGSDYKKIN